MLYKIDYTARGGGRESSGTKWVKFAADRVEATRRFMDWFFQASPGHKVRLDGITEVEMIGDLADAHIIDDAIASI